MKKIIVYVLALTAALLLVSCELTGKAPSKGTLHVVAIGDNFTNNPKVRSLSSCENDSTAMCQVLEYWGKKAGMETEILNCNGLCVEGFMSALDQVVVSSSDNDLTVIFMSSHGDNAVQSIVPYDEPNAVGEGIILEILDSDEIVKIRRSFFDSVAGMIKGKVVIIADTCYSGALIAQDNFTFNSSNYTGSNPVSLFFDSTPATDSNRVFYLSACTYYQEAQSGFTLSPFTQYLAESMGLTRFNAATGKATITSDAPVLKNNKIILSDIHRYIYERTAYTQVPQMSTGVSDLVLFSL